jgi:hypothetical protein
LEGFPKQFLEEVRIPRRIVPNGNGVQRIKELDSILSETLRREAKGYDS